jgi:NADPH2:quinone reductase
MSAVLNTATAARAVRLHEKAAALDDLKLDIAEQREPAAQPGFAVVRIGAAAVNPSDVKASLGLMPQAVWPRTPGRDFAGLVVAGPTEWVGREVYGSGGDIGITRDGSHARFLTLPVAALRDRPRSISMDEAGAVGVPFVTAYEGFRRSGMPQSGQTVLVLGANGKVGQAAVQLAAQGGARVIAVQRRAGPFEGFACGPVDVIDAGTSEVAAAPTSSTTRWAAPTSRPATSRWPRAPRRSSSPRTIARCPSTSSRSTAACTPTWASIRSRWTAKPPPRSSTRCARASSAAP